MFFIISSTQSTGAHFLDWSIFYLSGQTHYNHFFKGEKKLSKQPLAKINAHNHQLYCYHGEIEKEIDVITFAKEYQNKFRGTLSSFYYNGPKDNDEKRYLAEMDKLDDAFKVIFLTSNFDPLKVAPRFGKFEKFNNELDYYKNFIANNFGKAIDQRSKVRKFLLFNLKNLAPMPYPDNLCGKGKNRLFIDQRKFLNDPLKVIESVFEYLGLHIVTDRLEKFLKIHTKWKKIIEDNLYVNDHWNMICLSIIEGKKFDWPSMSVLQEAKLFHDLISLGVKPNLTIETLPTNSITFDRQVL